MTRLAYLAAASVALALTLVAPAGAVPPLHETFSIHIVEVDTEMCDFPVVREFDFSNEATALTDAAGNTTRLLLHQSTVGTLSANGTTLRFHIRETIIVDFAGGIPVTAKHVGLLDFIGGNGEVIFHRSGLAAFDVVFDPESGFYVDGPRTARHGLKEDFPAAEICAALG